jgi:hypothetical protein
VKDLLNNDPDGYAWGVWHDRTPQLIAQIRDAHPYTGRQRDALDRLWEEVSTGVMGPDTPYVGRPWLDAPFLWSEQYFFQRLLEAVDYFSPGPWHGVDPFAYLKTAELLAPDLEDDLAALPGDGQARLLASVWGNRADLGFLINRTALAAAALVADDSAALWSALGPDAQVVVVADNAGRELLADLVLIDHLLEHGHAATVTLHVKPHPYYVSDATTTDFVACLRRLSETPGSASEISARLWRTDRLRVSTHDFFCAPGSYHAMPADLGSEFAAATVTIHALRDGGVLLPRPGRGPAHPQVRRPHRRRHRRVPRHRLAHRRDPRPHPVPPLTSHRRRRSALTPA